MKRHEQSAKKNRLKMRQSGISAVELRKALNAMESQT